MTFVRTPFVNAHFRATARVAGVVIALTARADEAKRRQQLDQDVGHNCRSPDLLRS